VAPLRGAPHVPDATHHGAAAELSRALDPQRRDKERRAVGLHEAFLRFGGPAEGKGRQDGRQRTTTASGAAAHPAQREECAKRPLRPTFRARSNRVRRSASSWVFCSGVGPAAREKTTWDTSLPSRAAICAPSVLNRDTSASLWLLSLQATNATQPARGWGSAMAAGTQRSARSTLPVDFKI
jgi:hypothetical protein